VICITPEQPGVIGDVGSTRRVNSNDMASMS
jgi:hypothetical protein